MTAYLGRVRDQDDDLGDVGSPANLLSPAQDDLQTSSRDKFK